MPTEKRLVDAIEFAERQVRALVIRDPGFFPSYTTAGRWRNSGELWTDWCGGFLAGMMWLFHQRTGEAWWRMQAEHYSQLLEHRKLDRQVHDLGFIFLNSYRRWYEVSGDKTTMDVVAQAGITLAGRFQEKAQYVPSFLGPHSLFIDIMMNIPLLYVAADWIDEHGMAAADTPIPQPGFRGLSPSQSTDAHAVAAELRRIANAHSMTSQKYLVRPDGSTAHEAVFDPATGQFLRESTQQGLRADSCWSRGLAWALYGFGTVYRHTRDRQFLNTARRCADWFLAHLPAGHVPFWDFNLHDEPGDRPLQLNSPRGDTSGVAVTSDRLWDSSAAAIAAAGLLQLAEFDDESDRSTFDYRIAAYQILDALCQDEFLAVSRASWEGILCHGVYHIHKKLGVDESVMWGDHFFVEAVMRQLRQLKELKEKEKQL